MFADEVAEVAGAGAAATGAATGAAGAGTAGAAGAGAGAGASAGLGAGIAKPCWRAANSRSRRRRSRGSFAARPGVRGT